MPRVKAPKQIVNRVVYLYLRGYSLGDIAKSVNISKTAVFNIVHDIDKPVTHLRLCHTLVVNLKKNGLDVPHYAELIRAEKMLAKYGIDPKSAVKIIVDLVAACFRLEVQPSELVSFLNTFDQFLGECKGKSPKEIRKYMNDKIGFYFHLKSENSKEFERLQQFKREIVESRQMAASADLLVAEWINQLQREVEEKERQIRELKDKLEMQSAKNLESVQTNPGSMIKLRKSTGISLTRDDLLKKAYDITKYPDKYPELFIEELGEHDFPDHSELQAQDTDVPCLV